MDYPIRIAQIMGVMNNGGVESIVMNYYRNLNRNLFQFDFIVNEGSSCPQKEEIERLGGHVYFVPSYSNIFAYNNALKEIFLKNKYQIVHAEITTMNIFPLHVAKHCGVPIRISHGHNTSGSGEFTKNCLKGTLKLFARHNVTHFCACSFHAGKWLFGSKIERFPNFVVIPNAVQIDDFSYNEEVRNSLREKLGISKDAFVLGHIGRFVEQKNQPFILSIFREILKKKPDARLIFVGDGPTKDKIKALAENYKISDSVLFLEPDFQPAKYYSAMDAFVFPSLYEGFGMVLAEAQIAGLPCFISNNVPDEAVFVKNKVFRMPIDSSELWARTILEHSKKDRYVDKTLFRNYDVSNEVRNLEKLYTLMLQEKSIIL